MVALMLTKLGVENFKPFREYEVEFLDFNLLVGKNNMGKSTIVDALRLISLEANYRRRRVPREIPRRIFGKRVTGYELDLETLPFSITNVHHQYTDADCRINAEFGSGAEIHVVFTSTPRQCFLAVGEDGGFLAREEAIRNTLKDISMAVLPPVAAFEETEVLLDEKYVREWFGTHRSPRHFRNIWHYDPRDFERFQEVLRTTWPGVDISLPEHVPEDNSLAMYFTEDRITREISWAGHGMQVWMQLLTYLTKMREFSSLVLDEPEIFLHSDLQRKLVEVLRGMNVQTVVATHSVDIINESPPGSIIIVDKGERVGRRLESVAEVQRAVSSLGSVQNIQILNLIRSRFLLCVEGDDDRLLRAFEQAAGRSFLTSRQLAVVSLKGESNWRRLRDLNWIWHNSLGEQIRTFVVLDRDYRTDAEVTELEQALVEAIVGVHVWSKKEVENYLLVPDVLRRCLKSEIARRRLSAECPSVRGVETKLMELADQYKEDVRSQMLSHVLRERRPTGEDPSTTIRSFNARFDLRWGTRNRFDLVPGKELLSDLNTWLQESFVFSTTPVRIAGHFQSSEVDPEVVSVLDEIGRHLSSGVASHAAA